MFSQTPPKNVPTLDTASLVALITSPQKVAEYWALYEQHRKEYDAYKAAIDAEAAKLKSWQTALEADDVAINGKAWNLANDMKAFEEKLSKLREYQRAVEDREAALAATVAAKEQEFAGRQAALEKQRVAYETYVTEIEARLNRAIVEDQERAKDIVAREAAVAEREAKAEELAKLLKSV